MGWFSDIIDVATHFYQPETYGFGGGEEDTEGPDQADVANQREETRSLGTGFLSQLVPGSKEYNELQAEIDRLEAGVGSVKDTQGQIRSIGQQMVTAQQERIARGEPVTPQQAATFQKEKELRLAAAPVPFEQDVLNTLGGQPTTTPSGKVFEEALGYSPEELAFQATLRGETQTAPYGPAYQRIIDQANTTVNPDDIYQSTFGDQFTLLQDRIDQEMGRRGLGPSSGLRFEKLGRAGVDLAIAEAAQRQQARATAQAEQQQHLENLNKLVASGQNATTNRLSRTAGVYELGQEQRRRAIGLEEGMVERQLGRESRLTDIIANETSHRQDLAQALDSDRAAQAREDAQFAADSEASRRAMLGQTAGTLLGAGLGSFGGPAGMSLGASLGGSLGGSVAGGGATARPATTGTDVTALLASLRGAGGPAGNTGVVTRPSSSLSLASNPYDDLYNNLQSQPATQLRIR